MVGRGLRYSLNDKVIKLFIIYGKIKDGLYHSLLCFCKP